MRKGNEEEQGMKILVVTVAGMARRFSESVGKDFLKCLYYKENPMEALLFQMLRQASSFDRYIIVGGFLFEELTEFIEKNLSDLKDKILLVKNGHFADYGSCYSLYLGIKRAEEFGYGQLVFTEGDLFLDKETFRQICDTKSDVVTSNGEDICADSAVAFYYDMESRIHYLYDTEHKALRIQEPFTAVYNSGQVWKFVNKERLERIAGNLSKEELIGTNLVIIQKYFGLLKRKEYQQLRFQRWVNCNTLADFEKTLEG